MVPMKMALTQNWDSSLKLLKTDTHLWLFSHYKSVSLPDSSIHRDMALSRDFFC